MLEKYARGLANQTQAFMILMGYVMAYAAFFVVLVEYGGTSPSLKVMQWALILPPIAYAVAIAVANISQARNPT